MKYYMLLAALVLGLFVGVSPAFGGEIIPGDNVTFLTFDNEGKIGLEDGVVLDISGDGDWLLVYMPPEYLTVISKWFIYSDETIANRLLTKILPSREIYEPTGRANEEYRFREPAQQNVWLGQQQASEDQQLWRPNTVKSWLSPESLGWRDSEYSPKTDTAYGWPKPT